MQLVPWEQDREDEEPDAPCRRIDIEGANKVVFEDLRLSWDELDFIGVKKVKRPPARTRRNQCTSRDAHLSSLRALPGVKEYTDLQHWGNFM